MRLNQLEFLVALDTYGSFPKAADALYIAQPSISRAIKELENELGLQLIDRSGPKIFFTDEGKRVLEKSQAMVQLKNEIIQITAKPSTPAPEVISIGSSSTHCNMIIVSSAHQLKKSNLSVEPDILQEDFSSLLDLIHTNKIRLALTYTDPIRTSSYQADCLKLQIKFTPLYADNLCFIVGHDHPLAEKNIVTTEELFQYQFISASKKTSEKKAESAFFRNHGYSKNIIYINNYWNLQYYLNENQVFTIAPYLSIIETNIQSSNDTKQKILNVPDLKIPCQFGLLTKATANLSILEKELTKSIESYFNAFD